METILHPKSLQKGDTIAIVAPAKPTDESTLSFCCDQLNLRGYRTKIASNVIKRYGFFAGDERVRAEAFMECWCDPQVDAVWCMHGGYGCTPLLDYLDFERLKKHPKIFIGMSDVTALHAAINQRCQLMTFLGPTVGYLYAPHRVRYLPYSEKHLFEMLGERIEKVFVFPQLNSLSSGQGLGRITGGNLALIASLMGTPWQLNTKEKILVLEDVNEPPYRVDRMLCQLKQGGLLEELSGVVLCTWTGCETDGPTLSLNQVFERYFGEASYPVVSGFPSGHIDEQVTLPLNCLALLDADKKSLTFIHHKELLETSIVGTNSSA